MDYTDVPREMIYEDRNDIEFFGIGDNSRLEHKFFEKLLDRPFMRNKDVVEYIKDIPWLVRRIFNNAYYICTLVYLEKYTMMFFDEYKKIASDYYNDNLSWCHRVMPTTMALVYSLLVRSQYTDKNFLKRIMETFDNWDKEGSQTGKATFYEQVIYTDDADIIESDKLRLPDFAPRIITHKALGEAFPNTDKTKSWRYFTNDYDMDSIAETFACLGKTVEEKETMRQSFRWDVDAFCDKERKPRIIAQLEAMDFSTAKHAIEQGMEARYSQVVFENNLLRNDVEKIKKQQKESQISKTPSILSQTEESSKIMHTFDLQTKKISELEKLLKDYSFWEEEDIDFEALWEQKKTSAHQKIVFFLSVFGISLDEDTKKFYNQTELAKVISCLTKEKPSTIGPMISRIVQAKERIKNNYYCPLNIIIAIPTHCSTGFGMFLYLRQAPSFYFRTARR